MSFLILRKDGEEKTPEAKEGKAVCRAVFFYRELEYLLKIPLDTSVGIESNKKVVC